MLSDMAKRIFKDLYSFSDEKIDDTFMRVAKEFGNTDDEIKLAFDLLKNNIWRPNSPIFFNSGTSHKVFSACYVSGLRDSMNSIYDVANVARKIFQNGAGIGIPIGNLREKDALIYEGKRKEVYEEMVPAPVGKSSGPLSFMHLYDAVGATTKSGGRARRAAIMVAMPIWHPDVMEFIQCKKVDGTLSNMNISVCITDKFMQAFKDNIPFALTSPSDGTIVKELNARTIWDAIVDMSWETADPGVMFIDTINKYNTLKKLFLIECSNPCVIGETIIATADGRNGVSIKQLAEEKKDIPVYSRNINTGQIEIKMGRYPRKTGTKEVYKLTLDDGSILIATPDHQIMKKDLSYVSLCDLKKGDSLSPFNSFKSNKQYRQICECGKTMPNGRRRNRRQYRLIHEFYNGEVDPKKYAIHHKNYITKDDSIENLQIMLHEDHRKLHSEKMKGEKNPYHRMSDDFKRSFARHPGESNGMYSGITNEELLEHGRKLFDKIGKFTQPLWQEYARNNNIPWFVDNDFRFGKFSNFKSIVIRNHKVENIEPYGTEDVYNITVDDNHNYVVLTSQEDDNFIESSGICIKNCGEQYLAPFLACNLSSINLHSFAKGSTYDIEGLYNTAYSVASLMDNLIDKMEFPDPRFKDMVMKYRPIGIGFMGVSDTLFELGLPYDSVEGRSLIAECMKTITTACVDASSDIAKVKGPFSDYDVVKDDMLSIIAEHTGNNEKIIDKVRKYGVRNSQFTCVAPTGTTALSCDCSYGIEPCFGLVFTKTLIDSGDKYVFVNPIFQRKYEKEPWYTKDILEKIEQNRGSLKGIRGVPKEVRDIFVVAHDIKYKDRIDMQAGVQKYTSNAISSTLNLPSTTTRDEVSELYRYAYQKGLKGVTIYRDGSKKSQPISFTKDKTQVQSNFERPSKLQGNVHIIETGNGKMYVTVSCYNGRPVEIFMSMGKSGNLFNTFCEALGRTVSIALQHGVPVEAIQKTLIGINSDRPTWFRFEEQDKKPAQILSIPDAIAQLLKRYYMDNKEGATSEPIGNELCPKCGTYSAIKIEGCLTCANCGESRCG